MYSDGSGSNLNNVFGLVLDLLTKYGIAVVLYDYNGDEKPKESFNLIKRILK